GVEEKLETELRALHDQVKTSKDAYFIALVALTHLNRGDSALALELLKRLRDGQAEDGRLTGGTTSITASGGRDLEIETTALGLLRWLRANRPADFHGNIDRAVKWLGKQRGGHGAFGSTQSTILALKALIAFAQNNKNTIQPCEVRLLVNDTQVPNAAQSLTGETAEAITLSLPSTFTMNPGLNRIGIE